MTLKDLGAESDEIRIFVGDFFNVEPKGQIVLPWLADPKAAVRRADLDAKETELGQEFPVAFDAIVANPPYIRQEQIPDKKKVRKHLGAKDGEFSSRSDIYAYFFTHATEFLKQGGRMGFIVSNRWLFTEYGEDLQRFFLKNYVIEAVVLLERQQFLVPLIGTCVVFMRRCADSYQVGDAAVRETKFDDLAASTRAENLVKFVRVHGAMSVGELLGVIEGEDFPPKTLVERPTFSVYCMKQADLGSETKWSKFFAPKVVHDILGQPGLVTLGTIFEAERGITSGANGFFYLKLDDAKERGIAKKYLRPLMKSVGQVEYIEFGEGDTEWYVLDLHQHIQKIIAKYGLEKKQGRDLTRAVIRGLKEGGAAGLAGYIEDAEREKIHQGPTVVGRQIWFDLGPLTIPVLMFTKEYWRHAVCCTNPDGVVLDQHLYSLIPKIKGDTGILAGIMNSALVPLLREIYGREASGEALNRNEFTVAEAKVLPIVDGRKLGERDRKRIGKAFADLVEIERTADSEELTAARRKLDAAVLRSIGMEERRDEVYAAIEEYIRRRTEAGGLRKRALVY